MDAVEALLCTSVPVFAGQYKMVGGELKSTSLDCYLSMELGEDGDLFNMR